MRTLTKTRITLTVAAASVFMLAVSASMMFAPIHAESSIRVTQSTGDGTSSQRVTQSTGDGTSSQRVTQSTGDGTSSLRVTQSTGDGTSSLRVTQSNEEGLEVKCEGNLNCEIIGDDTVVATSEDNDTTSTAAVTSNLNQSNTIQSDSDFDIIDENEQDLGAMIEGMVDRLLDDISAQLTNSLSLFRLAY